jgi:hypothetical protein
MGAGHIGGSTNNNPSEGFYPQNGLPIDSGQVIVDPNQNAQTTIPTTPEQDAKFDRCMQSRKNAPGSYNVMTRNCNHLIKQCLSKAGIPNPGGIRPNSTFCRLAKKYGCKGSGCSECK